MRALSDATAGLLKPMRLASYDRLRLDVDETRKHFLTRVYATESEYNIKRWPSNDARNGWIARVPERKQLEDGSWLLAATDYTAEIINAVWPREQIEFEGDYAETLLDYLLLTTAQQDDNAEMYARYKDNGTIPAHNVLLHPDYPLTPYQQVIATCAMRSEGYGEFCEQGTGKTAPVIAKICTHAAERTDSDPYTAVIVCPKNVRTNWVREFERFATTAGKVQVIKGSKLDRRAQILEAFSNEADCLYSVLVMSYQGLVRDIDFIENFNFDLAVADEAHAIASPKTKQHRACMQLRDVSRCRMPLTGTPMANTPLDLYALFEFMHAGGSGFQSWENFRNFYGVYASPDGDSYKKLVAIQNTPFMKERLARTAFIIRKEEALPDLPAKVYDTHEVEMSDVQIDCYKKLAEEMAWELESELDASENKSITINHVLTKLLRLAQVACGFVAYDAIAAPNTGEILRPRTLEFFNPNPKLDGLMELLADKTPDEKTIVWSTFVPCIDTISERLTMLGMNHVTFYGKTGDEARLEAERRFNCDPDCRILVGNPAAGGVGLNLLGYPPHAGDGITTNCNHHIYYACDWSFIKRDQSEARSHRRGTRVPVRITDLVVPDTIDEEIRVRVLKKKHAAFELTDVREILANVMQSLKLKVSAFHDAA